MNFTNSKISNPHRLLINVSDKINLNRRERHVVLSNLSTYYIWKSITKSYKNNEFKISAPT